ncbi:MAG: TrbI/VirB10 family protein [Alphaproteobacteria bacterium]|nr:TrbI/VirB10 family protein [Alphaproteobacteria bacterium]
MKLPKIGGIDLQIRISKIGKIVMALFLVVQTQSIAYAADISAIDFNGDLLGKVIPDGSVISFEREAVGEVIGHITADGFVLSEDDELIGGIVPRGIVISTTNTILGKVNNDGSVTSANDSVIGKVLPSGLVVNNDYTIIGSVITSGLVYNDNGGIVGRISGNGRFYSLSGENNGFITSTGHVYSYAGTNNRASLVGRLIISKMVISFSGKFLGSISPDGKVVDLKKNVIGNIHANGFAYNADGEAIGHIVESGYAFNTDGSYIGVVSYNGEVTKRGEVVAQTSFGNRVIDKNGKIIGFSVPLNATANGPDGKYIGRINPNGNIVKARNVVGKISASGSVIDSQGKVIGQINQVGPLFDYLGQLRANATVDGTVMSLEGNEQGYMQKDVAYDHKEKEIGRLLQNYFNFDNKNTYIGVSGIGTSISYKGQQFTISPYGYLFNDSSTLEWSNYPLSSIYNSKGEIIGNIAGDGKLTDTATNIEGKLTGAGYFIDKANNLQGAVIKETYATDFSGQSLGYINQQNQLLNSADNIYARILPDGSVVENNIQSPKLLGRADNRAISISINGDYLGTNTLLGRVRKDSEEIGRISSNQYIVDNQGALYGKAIPFGAIVSAGCKFLGVVSDSGDARTAKGAYLGMILANNQVINDSEEVIGYIIKPQQVNGKNGEVIGIETPLGRVLNYDNQNLGCQDINGKIRGNQNEIIGQIIPIAPVMDFNNTIIGHTNFNKMVEDETGREIGYVDIEGGVRSLTDKQDIGVLMQYTVAFNENSTYLGRIDTAGNVIADGGDVIGHVNYDGSVTLNDGNQGFALYDLYVYDNQGHTVGYISKNGRVYSIMGDVKGAIYYGFVLDKKQNLIARGSRDYEIRDNNQTVIGTLGLDGVVTNSKNIEVGKLAENGNIIDSNGQVIAQANAYQYYHRFLKANQEPEENPIIEETIAPQPEEQQEFDASQRTVGITVSPSSGEDFEEEVVEEETPQPEPKTTEKKQPAKPKTNNSKWWQDVVSGVTISPWSDTETISNVGPGGGIGPGGRYNPKRAAVLQQLYNSRRQNLSGKVINGKSASAYTGWENDWRSIGYGRSNENTSTLRVDMSLMITADKPIPAILARSVISLGDAPVTAIVERNVYGDSGRNVIIPAGSRIIGAVDEGGASNGRFDATSGGLKMEITWYRIIRPDGIAFNIRDAKTGDAEGRGGGALGYVDEQLLKKYTVPLLGSVATSAVAYLMATNEDATGEVETSKQQAASDARQNFLDKMDQILNKIIESKEQIQAVTYIPAGTRVIVYPMRDLWLRTMDNIKGDGKNGADNRDGETKKVLISSSNKEKDKNVQGNNNRNKNNNNNRSKSSQKSKNNTNNTGALPPPSADGTGAKMPEASSDDGEIDLDF